MKNSEIFLVIPVYNEARNIRKLLESIRLVWPRVIVVDDGSTDKTVEIVAQYPSIKLIKLAVNKGKGWAMKMGAVKAWQLGAKAIIFMDGDNQHSPKHIPEFVNVLKRGYEIVVGVRLLKTNIPWHRKLGNNIMTGLMRLLFQVEFPDMMCGYRALTKRGYKRVEWISRRYGVEIEMLATIGRRKLPYQTIIVDTIYHDRYKGFSIWDGIKIMLSLPYYRMKRI